VTYIENGQRKYKAVSESFFERKEDEKNNNDIILLFKKHDKSKLVKVCRFCGVFENNFCNHENNLIDLYEYNPSFYQDSIEDNIDIDEENPVSKGCVNCGSGSKIEKQIVSLTLPPNGATAILASVLYAEAPEMSEDERIKNNSYFASIYGRRNDDWSPIIEKGKKLIVFSDSRQDASFFGPYLQVSHNQLIINKLVYQFIKNITTSINLDSFKSKVCNEMQNILDNKTKFAIFLKDLRPIIEENYTHTLYDEFINTSEIEFRVYHSILSLIDRNGIFLSGIEGLGLGLAYFNLNNFNIPFDKINLSKKNIYSLIQLILFYLRRQQSFDLSKISDDTYYNDRYQVNILKRPNDEKSPNINTVRLVSREPNLFQQLIRKAIY
ncbi:MAG: hypothetical protein ACK4IX_16350, partial [Candidatus Sericytochromatia bacterium]